MLRNQRSESWTSSPTNQRDSRTPTTHGSYKLDAAPSCNHNRCHHPPPPPSWTGTVYTAQTQSGYFYLLFSRSISFVLHSSVHRLCSYRSPFDFSCDVYIEFVFEFWFWYWYWFCILICFCMTISICFGWDYRSVVQWLQLLNGQMIRGLLSLRPATPATLVRFCWGFWASKHSDI